MELPFFYIETLPVNADATVLNEDNSRHAVQVLRMQNGEQLKLTDGKGKLYSAEITDNHKKKCAVSIISVQEIPPPARNITIAISLVKNAHRFEWFLEKATEIGVTAIIPLICMRTEKQHFRHERMNGILVSAMLQSQQAWLPELHEPVKFPAFIHQQDLQQKFIAHCEEDTKAQITAQSMDPDLTAGILIGPEGDFSKEEIAAALAHNFIPVALGGTRLRTETAGVVAATILQFL